MKKIFMKAMTVLGGAALIGSTMAGAAMYPAPLTSNTAIIVGANAALSDNAAAANIASNLDSASAGMGGTVSIGEGESYKLEKTSTKYHIGDALTSVVSATLDDGELEDTLADGKFLDTNNDEFDYTQKVVMGALTLTMFEDNDYIEDEPTLGFRVASGTTVATYTLDFSDMPTISNMDNTDLTLMGKSYYVLDTVLGSGSTNNKLTLLDSAEDTILSEGSSTTVNAGSASYTAEIVHIASAEVILSINGEQTNSMGEGETYKLSSGAYVGVKDILYSSKDTGISKVEFSIGNGKLILENGQTVELNEDDVDGLTATVTNSSTELSLVSIAWLTDDDEFITESQALTMPGFETISFAYTGVNYPAEEEIQVQAGSDTYLQLNDFPLKDSVEDIPLVYTNGTAGTVYAGIGKDSTGQLATGGTSVTFDADEDDYFVITYNDGSDAESYLAKATNFKIENSVNKTTIQYREAGSWKNAEVDAKAADTFDLGNAALVVGAIDKLDKQVTLTNGTAQTNFKTLYSKEGFEVHLPTETSTDTGYINISALPTSYTLTMEEEDKDGDISAGTTITATIGLNSNNEVSVTANSGGGGTDTEIQETDVFRNFVYSALATEILHDKSGDRYELKLVYHGGEVAADVYVTAQATTGSSTSGVKTYTDANVASAAGMNLVVVGGSAINSVAAELLGGAFRESEFTTATGVGAGEFLIQSFDRGGKTALLVAGYNAADTTKAATFLVNEDVDTTVGNKYKGTTATEASMVTV